MGVLITKNQKSHEQKLLRQIGAARESGRTKRTEYFVCEYLNSHDARLVATVRAFRGIAPHRRQKLSQLHSIARALDPRKGTSEPVVVHFKPKRSNPNDYRPVMDFGIENRALQYLVLAVLQKLVDLHPHQYATRGGAQAAVGRAVQLMEQGYQWAAEMDIADCYRSFDEKQLSSLIPLPEEVTQHVITAECLYLVGGNIYDFFGPAEDGEEPCVALADHLADARQGIPQGSAASPFVAEELLAHSLHLLPPVGEVTAYADNTLLMARSEAEAVSMVEALSSALKAHPAGRLRPKLEFFKPGEPIEFLGHCLVAQGEKIHVHPTAVNEQKFATRMTRGFNRLKRTNLSPGERSKEKLDLRGYVCSWTAAFRLCNGIAATKADWLAKIAAA